MATKMSGMAKTDTYMPTNTTASTRPGAPSANDRRIWHGGSLQRLAIAIPQPIFS